MMKTEQKAAKILLTVYLILLTWVVLFKMRTSLGDLGEFRRLNLIPYGKPAVVNGQLDLSEIVYNIAAFVPVGIYVSMLRPRWRFPGKILPAAGISLVYEILQYILGIGASDITDWIHNTLGGLLGVLIYLLAVRILGKQTDRIIVIFAGICTVFLLLLTVMLLAMN